MQVNVSFHIQFCCSFYLNYGFWFKAEYIGIGQNVVLMDLGVERNAIIS